jgi:hypothetical protein
MSEIGALNTIIDSGNRLLNSYPEMRLKLVRNENDVLDKVENDRYESGPLKTDVIDLNYSETITISISYLAIIPYDTYNIELSWLSNSGYFGNSVGGVEYTRKLYYGSNPNIALRKYKIKGRASTDKVIFPLVLPVGNYMAISNQVFELNDFNLISWTGSAIYDHILSTFNFDFSGYEVVNYTNAVTLETVTAIIIWLECTGTLQFLPASLDLFVDNQVPDGVIQFNIDFDFSGNGVYLDGLLPVLTSDWIVTNTEFQLLQQVVLDLSTQVYDLSQFVIELQDTPTLFSTLYDTTVSIFTGDFDIGTINISNIFDFSKTVLDLLSTFIPTPEVKAVITGLGIAIDIFTDAIDEWSLFGIESSTTNFQMLSGATTIVQKLNVIGKLLGYGYSIDENDFYQLFNDVNTALSTTTSDIRYFVGVYEIMISDLDSGGSVVKKVLSQVSNSALITHIKEGSFLPTHAMIRVSYKVDIDNTPYYRHFVCTKGTTIKERQDPLYVFSGGSFLKIDEYYSTYDENLQVWNFYRMVDGELVEGKPEIAQSELDRDWIRFRTGMSFLDVDTFVRFINKYKTLDTSYNLFTNNCWNVVENIQQFLQDSVFPKNFTESDVIDILQIDVSGRSSMDPS